MKFIAFFLAINLAALQYQIWNGKGGWNDFTSLSSQLTTAENANNELQIRNDAMQAEIKDLNKGTEAIIETSRKELGYIKNSEFFYQILK